MSLPKLEKPLAVFDIESTGINRKVDRIIDLSIITLMPDGSRKSDYFRINPSVSIPLETTEIHGISNADVADSPLFKDVAMDIMKAFGDSDLAGYNLLHFDIPILIEEFARCNLRFDTQNRRVLDAQKIYHKKEPRDLSAALAYYAGEDHSGAHSAVDDVEATIKVIEGQFKMYDDLPQTMDEISDYCNPKNPEWVDRAGRLKWQNKKVVINFGKQQGADLEELAISDRGFLNWILKNDFPRETQDIVRHFMNGGQADTIANAQ